MGIVQARTYEYRHIDRFRPKSQRIQGHDTHDNFLAYQFLLIREMRTRQSASILEARLVLLTSTTSSSVTIPRAPLSSPGFDVISSI
jgi:uncharacterized membrane-anchored protein